MKCWNCGRENNSRDAYCSFCASHLEDPDDHKEPRAPVRVILKRVGIIAAIEASWLAVFVASITAVVAVYNTLTEAEFLHGLGLALTGVGAVVAFCAMLSLGRIPERYVATRGTRHLGGGVFYNTMFKPLFKTMTKEPSRTEVRVSATLTFVGVSAFMIGLFLI